MFQHFLPCFFALSSLLAPQLKQASDLPYITGSLHNQLGNQLFEIAATVGLALDHGAIPLFPDLKSVGEWDIPKNYQNIFFRLNTFDPRKTPSFSYEYTGLDYQEIPYVPGMSVRGYFQSEKYFKRHKEDILELFAPSPSILVKLVKKHRTMLAEPLKIGVHIRCYWPCHREGIDDGRGVLPFLGFEYFKRAMKFFPADALFVIFSDNIPLCKKKLSGVDKRLYFVENQASYLDLHLMSMCDHNIISNSSFSWWGAYLNKNPDKIVVAPSVWLEPHLNDGNINDIIPEEWIIFKHR